MAVCAKCGEETTEEVTCGQCSSQLHFRCSGLLESTWTSKTAKKKQDWRCQACRANNVVPTQESINAVLAEIKAFRNDFANLQAGFKTIQDDTHTTSQTVVQLNQRLGAMEEQFASFSSVKSELTQVQADLLEAKTTIANLENDNKVRDQLSRMNNIELSGVPVASGQNLHTIFRDICAKVGFELRDSDIDTIHRVRRFPAAEANTKPRTPAIIIRFTQRRRKDQLLAAVRVRRDLTTQDVGLPGPPAPLYLNEHLTPANKQLLKLARDAKKEFNYQHLWVRDCKIMMRKSDTSKFIHISQESDIKSKIK
ncbi:hypothetical protein NE865_00512 [Phthorimaea operculella]|nr:hypothetical protein NE865_00512 [Phthorimaea operculella]